MPPKYQKKVVSNPQNKTNRIESGSTANVGLTFNIEIICSNLVFTKNKDDSHTYSKMKIDLETGELGYNSYTTVNTYKNAEPVFKVYADYVDLLIDGELVDEGIPHLQSVTMRSRDVTDSDGDFQYTSSSCQSYYIFKTKYRTYLTAEVKKSLFGKPKAVFNYNPEVKVIFYNNTEPYEYNFGSAMRTYNIELEIIENKWVAQKEIDVRLTIPHGILAKMKREK